MKILMVAPSFAPSHNGLANVVLKYVLFLMEKGHSVDVVTTGKQNYVHEGVNVICFKVQGSFTFRNPIRGDLKTYVSFLRESNYDVVICHAMQTAIVDLALLYCSSPRVYFSHGVSWASEIVRSSIKGKLRLLNYWPYRLLGPKLIGQAKAAVFLGDKPLNDRTMDMEIFSHKCRVTIPNASDMPIVAPKSYQSVDKLKILVVGACSQEKGFDRLLQVLAHLSERAVQCITICTFRNSDSVSWFNKARVASGTIELKMAWDKKDQELMEYYRDADLFLNLSHSECLPLVLCDAQNMRLPSLAFDEGYQSEMGGVHVVSCIDDVVKFVNSYPRNRERLIELSKETTPRLWRQSGDALENFLLQMTSQFC